MLTPEEKEISKEKRKEYIRKYRLSEKYIKYQEKYREENREYFNEYNLKYREENKEEIKYKGEEYYINNKERLKDIRSNYKMNNIEKIKENQIEYVKEYREENKEYFNEYNLKYREENRESINIKRNIRLTNRRKTDSLFKLKCSIRTLIGNSIRKKYNKSKKTIEILGCSFNEFYKYLENKFDENMNWDNHGKYWQIDHIKPISLAETEKEIYELNHYTNLRPLYWKDNLSKSNKFEV